MRDVFIAGVGQRPVNKDPHSRGRYLGAAAVKEALADAPFEPDGSAPCTSATCSPAFRPAGQLDGLIPDYTGLSGIEAVTDRAACASGGAVVRMAYQAVAGGITMSSRSAASNA